MRYILHGLSLRVDTFAQSDVIVFPARIANNHQPNGNISSAPDKSIRNAKIRQRDSALLARRGKNTKRKVKREGREGKERWKKIKTTGTMGGSQNRYNTKDQTFRIAMLYEQKKRKKKTEKNKKVTTFEKSCCYCSTYIVHGNRGNKSTV